MKMKVEIDGKETEIELKTPSYERRWEILKLRQHEAKGLMDFRKKLNTPDSMTPEEVDEGVNKLIASDRQYLAEIAKQVVVGPNTVEELVKLSGPDVKRLRNWFNEALDIEVSEEKKGFTKT